MKLSAILFATAVAMTSLTVNAQDHPKKDTAHHEHKGPEGKKGFAPKDKATGPVKDTANHEHKGPQGKGKAHEPKQTAAAAKQ
jgi:hypothetical protein